MFGLCWIRFDGNYLVAESASMMSFGKLRNRLLTIIVDRSNRLKQCQNRVALNDGSAVASKAGVLSEFNAAWFGKVRRKLWTEWPVKNPYRRSSGLPLGKGFSEKLSESFSLPKTPFDKRSTQVKSTQM